MTQIPQKDILAELIELIRDNPISVREYKVDHLRIEVAMALKKVRQRAGKTQKQIAKILGVNQTWISKMESCNNDHPIESIAKYAIAIGADISLNMIFKDDTTTELASSKTDPWGK